MKVDLARKSAVVGLALVIAIAVVRLSLWAWTHQVSFDGAMNLEVARSLAEGDGYRRMYAGREAFPHAVQTRAPYILPAAAVFAFFGVGIWQAQLVNLLYLFGLALLAFVLLRRWVSWRWGLLAAAVVLCTPGLEENALNGYGEVPALFWWLGALLVLHSDREEQPTSVTRCLMAGAMIGVAIVTKTVLLIGLAATVPIFVLTQLRCRRNLRSVALRLGALLCGILLPLVLYEGWHALTLGDLGNWKHWLRDELQSVHMQAGTHQGFTDTPQILTKVAVHFGTLATETGIPELLLVVWLAAPMLLAFTASRWCAAPRVRPLLLTLAVFALIYFLWWLGFTPTQKAWYRRIFNGVVVAEVLMVLVAGLLWSNRPKLNVRAHLGPRAVAIGLAMLPMLLAGLGVSTVVASATTSVVSSRVLAEKLSALQRLPANAPWYGVGWYSAPKVALYSGHRIGDINVETPAGLAQHSPAVLLLDASALTTQVERYWLQRYEHRQVIDAPDLRVFILDTERLRNPFEDEAIDAASIRGYVDFREIDYPYLFGFYQREGEGWRWTRPDAEILLRYAGEQSFKLDLFMPETNRYRYGGTLAVTVWINDCRLGTIRQDQSLLMQWRLPAANCPLQVGDVARVRLQSDNVFESKDDRQVAYVVQGVGFATEQRN